MCIAILNTGTKITINQFKLSLQNNPDGFGLAYLDGKKIKTFKSLSNNYKELYKTYTMYFEKFKGNPILLHFRIGTGSKIDLFNCHPFMVNNSMIMMHNGIISQLGNKIESDTVQFARLLSGLESEDIYYNESLRDLIEFRIGYSKLVFLNTAGEYSIINEDLGQWDICGNWFSNSSYLPYVAPKYNKLDKYDAWDYEDLPNVKKKGGDSKCDSCLQSVISTENYEGFEICDNCFNEYDIKL